MFNEHLSVTGECKGTYEVFLKGSNFMMVHMCRKCLSNEAGLEMHDRYDKQESSVQYGVTSLSENDPILLFYMAMSHASVASITPEMAG